MVGSYVTLSSSAQTPSPRRNLDLGCGKGARMQKCTIQGPLMENQLEQKMQNDMESGFMQGNSGDIQD